MKIGNVDFKGETILAPMAGVTDKAFRLICKSLDCGLVYTEMVSAKALSYNDKKTKEIMDIAPKERPTALQIFGSDPDNLGKIAYELNEHNNDILDINFGCPAPKIVKNGDGSKLLTNIELSRKIITNVVKNSDKPVTVKIRTGWDENSINAVEFSKMAESCKIDALAIHGRTRNQFYSGKADWDVIKEVKDNLEIPVIANGDVFSLKDAIKLKEKTNCDGIMIGRGARGNPWLFKKINKYFETGKIIKDPTLSQKLDVLEKQFDLMAKFKGKRTSLLQIRKHAGWYLKGIKNAAKLRNKVNHVESVKEFKKIIKRIRINQCNSLTK